MKDFLVLFVGGGFGAAARYGTGLLAERTLGEDFPWGTLLVNVGGSLLIGVLMHFALTAEWMTPRAKLALVTGFCGAFTTFSTFSYETTRAIQAGDYRVAALNVGLNVVLCLGATFLGLYGASRIP
jgi:fluoride exporter